MISAPRFFESGLCNRHYLDHWLKIGVLKTQLAPTVAGSRRMLSRENCRELAFMVALARLGTAGAGAARVAAEWEAEYQAGTLTPFIAFDGLGNDLPFGDPTMGFVDLATALSERDPVGYADRDRSADEFLPSVVISVIDRGEILRRIDELFEEEGD